VVGEIKRGPSGFPTKGVPDGPQRDTPEFVLLEEAITVLFCEIDGAYRHLNPDVLHHYESLKKLSDSEVITLALFQRLRGIESDRSFLREAARFFSHLFPGVLGLHPSSLHRRVRKLLRRYLEPLRRTVLPEELVRTRDLDRRLDVTGSPASASSRPVYGVKLHLLCATNRVPLSL
jgi:hypothetical protein